MSSGIPSIQIPGRLSRLDKEKSIAYLIDMQDDFCEQAEARAKKREKTYQEQGWSKVSLFDILKQLKERKIDAEKKQKRSVDESDEEISQ